MSCFVTNDLLLVPVREYLHIYTSVDVSICQVKHRRIITALTTHLQ